MADRATIGVGRRDREHHRSVALAAGEIIDLLRARCHAVPRPGEAHHLELACIELSQFEPASFASPPVDRNIALESEGGSIEASRRDSSTTGGLSMPLKRCKAPSQASAIACTMRG